MKSVYLAGPISGLTYDECVNWRKEASRMLSPYNIQALSPMRFKEDLATGQVIGPWTETEDVLSTQRGIVARDFFDVHRCDLLLVNLLGAPRVSVGTMFELAWAFKRQIPVVLMIEGEGNPNDHPFVREAAQFVVGSFPDALDTVLGILL